MTSVIFSKEGVNEGIQQNIVRELCIWYKKETKNKRSDDCLSLLNTKVGPTNSSRDKESIEKNSAYADAWALIC